MAKIETSLTPRCEDDNELKDIINLLHNIITKVHTFGLRCLKAEKELDDSIRVNEELNNNCLTLQMEVKNLLQKPCTECPKLKSYIHTHKKRVVEVESRLKSIAEILKINSGSDNFPVAYSIASQILTDDIKGEKRLHENSDESPTDVEDEKLNRYSTTSTDSSVSDADLYLDQMTPKKQKTDKQGTLSPVIYKRYNKKKISLKQTCSPIKKENLIQNNTERGRSSIPLPIDIVTNKCNKHRGNILQEISDNSNIMGHKPSSNVELNTPDDLKETKVVWSLKKSRDIPLQSKRKLKQTSLSVTIEKKEDISKISEPNEINECPEISDETIFIPSVTSTVDFGVTDMLNNEQNDRACFVITKNDNEQKKGNFVAFPIENDDPPYKYRRGPVRKKEERNQLPGQDCQNCYKYFENKVDELSTSQLQAFKNTCSRHRDKYPIRYNTPPGFWNPQFDDSDDSDLSQKTET